MKCLVIGCGSIGERHIGNLKKISVDEILAYDVDVKQLKVIKEKYAAVVYDDMNKALSQEIDVVFVCTPPSSHISIALEAVENDAHVFIEKPLSNNLRDINTLLQNARKKNLMICVGYNLRFNKGLQLVKKMIDAGKLGQILTARAEFGQYLPDWRPWQDYTKSYTAKKDLGGGIILDGSHEIDYMRWFFGEAEYVFCLAEKTSNLQVETEDVAEILIKFKKKILCEIHLDFIRPGYTRNCEIIGEKGVVLWDFSTNTVKFYDSEKREWDVTGLSSAINDMYIDEVKQFLYSIKNEEEPLINGVDGKKTLQLVLAAKESAKTHKLVKL